MQHTAKAVLAVRPDMIEATGEEVWAVMDETVVFSRLPGVTEEAAAAAAAAAAIEV